MDCKVCQLALALTDLHYSADCLMRYLTSAVLQEKRTTFGKLHFTKLNILLQKISESFLFSFEVNWGGTHEPQRSVDSASMARYLKYFTTVGDEQPAQFEDEELLVASEEPSPATGQVPATLSFRDSLKRLYSSEHFQVFHYILFTKCGITNDVETDVLPVTVITFMMVKPACGERILLSTTSLRQIKIMLIFQKLSEMMMLLNQ